MTPIRRRAILAAVVGAFAQLAEAQQKKDGAGTYFHVDDGLPVLAALELNIQRVDGMMAIRVKAAGETAEITPAELMEALRPRKPKNNECPVCGTTAERVTRQVIAQTNCRAVPGSKYIVACDPVLGGPDQNLIRCKNCNAAFWRDAE